MKPPIEVTIAGQRYLLKRDGDDARLRALADYVDRQMKEVGAAARGLSGERLAVLTALNIADELWRQRERHRLLRAEVRRRTEVLLGYLRGLAPTAEAPPAEDGWGAKVG